MTKRHHLAILTLLFAIGVGTTFILAFALDSDSSVKASTLQDSPSVAEPDETLPVADDAPVDLATTDVTSSEQATPSPEVATFTELIAAIADQNITKITLTADIIATDNIFINRNLEIDLNGHNISSLVAGARLLDVHKGDVRLSGNGKIVASGAGAAAVRLYGSTDPEAKDFTIFTVGPKVTLEALADEDSYGLFISYSGTAKVAYGVEVNILGTVSGYQGLTINGNIQHKTNAPSIIIEDAATIKANSVDGFAIYAAGYGFWDIKSATIAGATSLGAKAGIFNFSHSTVIASGAAATGTPHNGSIDSTGATFQIEDHSAYAGSVKIAINGGKYTSDHNSVFYEYSDQGAAPALSGLTITSGEFVAADTKPVFSDLRAGAVSLKGGTYNSDIAAYLSDDQKYDSENLDGKVTWVVKPTTTPAEPEKPTADSPSSGVNNAPQALAAVATTTAAVIAGAIVALGILIRCIFVHHRIMKEEAMFARANAATRRQNTARRTSKSTTTRKKTTAPKKTIKRK